MYVIIRIMCLSVFCAMAGYSYAQVLSNQTTDESGRHKPFNHPGLMHTEEDFDRMRAKVGAKEQPWLAAWEMLVSSRHAQLDWTPRPVGRVIRGNVPGQNVGQLFNDIHAAYQLAVRWKVSGDEAYAQKSIAILNAWSTTLKHKPGGNSDRFLAAGIYGYQFANAAEVMRTYSGWAEQDFQRFQEMMLSLFYPANRHFLTHHNSAAITNYWANWDLCNIASMQAIGVLCDRRDIYDEAMAYVYRGEGNGAIDKAIYYVHPGNLGQWQESGRDQGHNTLGIALMGPICETAWNQGDDLYGYDNNRFLAGAEYIAKYNLGEDVPFQKYAWGTGQGGGYREQLQIASHDRGTMRAGYELVINHYVNRKGIDAPWSEAYAGRMRPERGGGGHASTFDQLGLGTLTATREPEFQSSMPSGLTARLAGDQVVLSWWGVVGGKSYRVHRARTAEGPYETIGTVVPGLSTFIDRRPREGDNYYTVSAVLEKQISDRSDVAAVSTTPDLIVHLTMETTAKAGATGHAFAGAPATAGGKLGRSIELDGIDDYVTLPEGVVDDLSDFTIAVWVYLDERREWSRLFDFGGGRGRYMYLTPQCSAGGPRFSIATVWRYNE